jgi:hypothetical protein
MVVFVALSIVIGIIPVLGNLAGYVLGPIFAGGLMLGCQELARGGELRLGHLFAGFQDQLGRLALLGVAYLVMVLGALFVAFAVAGAGLGFGWLLGMGGGDAQPAGLGTTTILLAALVALALMVPAAMAIWFAPALVVLNVSASATRSRRASWPPSRISRRSSSTARSSWGSRSSPASR